MSFTAYPEQTAHVVNHYFRVEIDASLSPSTAEGFIDHLSPKWYGENGGFPTTNEAALAKERSNMRFDRMIETMSENISPVQITAITSDATKDSIGTSFAFTVAFDRVEYLTTIDETNNNSAITDHASALKRMIARAFVFDFTKNREEVYYPPAEGEDFGYNFRSEDITAGKFSSSLSTIEAAIVVTAMDLIPDSEFDTEV